MRSKIYFCGVILAIFLVGCNVTSYQYNVSYPPEFLLPLNAERVGIGRRAPYGMSSFFKSIFTGTLLPLDDIVGDQTIVELDKSLAGTQNKKYILIPRDALPQGNNYSFISPIDEKKLYQVGNEYNLDLLIVLEYLDMQGSLNGPTQVKEKTKDPKTKQEIVNIYYTGDISYITYAGFRIYDVKTGKVIFERTYKGQNSARYQSNTPEAVEIWLRNPNVHRDILQKIPPLLATQLKKSLDFLNESRQATVYIGPGNELKECGSRINSKIKAYEEAIQICKNYFDLEYEPKKKARLAHNIAVLYEISALDKPYENQIQSIDSALLWLDKGKAYMPNFTSSTYANYLTKRKKALEEFLQRVEEMNKEE